MTICPKCQYRRQAGDSQVHEGICPRCGIAYAKYRAPEQTFSDNEETDDETRKDLKLSFRRRLVNSVTYVPEQVDTHYFRGCVCLYGIFVIWGCSFILGGIDWESIGGSFMHNINLPFHEFGHVLFGFFGRFMGILGGSLFQVLMPLVFVFAFSLQKQDNFAASICLWWCGQNFIDVSPYIADAPYRGLPLIRGMSEDAHDWGNLLTMTNSLDSAQAYANSSFIIGCGLMVVSFSWGGWILWQQYKQID